MSKSNTLNKAPPFAIVQSIQDLGRRLRTARLRRNLSVADVASKIGTGVRAVAEAEKGSPSAGIGTYWALLWAYDLMGPEKSIADPGADAEGLALEVRRERAGRARTKLDNDF
jgi:transcriptional regulator with XRE-family HTH domain